MLHLRRRIGEEIIISDEIRVIVLGIKGNQVQLGVTAPRSVPVDRKEIHERRMQGRLHPAQTDGVPTRLAAAPLSAPVSHIGGDGLT